MIAHFILNGLRREKNILSKENGKERANKKVEICFVHISLAVISIKGKNEDLMLFCTSWIFTNFLILSYVSDAAE